MKKTLLSLTILAASMGLAQAHNSGVSGNANIGGSISTFTGTIGGNAGSSATSSGQVATEVIGTGKSMQSQGNVTQSGASLGGKITPNGVSVTTASFGNTVSMGAGKVSGNAPLISADGNQSILNGGASFGDAESTAGVTSRFDAAKVGAGLSLHGFAQIGSF